MADPTFNAAKIYRTSTSIVVDAGGSIDLTSGKITMPGALGRRVIQLDIFAARVLSSGEAFIGANFSATGISLGSSVGGMLHAGSVPTLTMNSTLNQAAVLTWASGQTPAVAFPPISIPPDFSSAGGLEIHVHAERASDNASNNVLDLRFWANNNATEQGTTGATLTSTPADYSITVSSAEVGAYPGFWNVQIVPGTHTNNAVKVYGGYLRYTLASS